MAALCFAVLSGLHVARPVLPISDLAILGFSVEDICGEGAQGAGADCPNCALSDGVCQPANAVVLLWTSQFADRSVQPVAIVLGAGQASRVYQPRAPPQIT